MAKRTLNIAIIGHIDTGKSTILGNLLFQSGQIDQRAIQNYEKQSAEMGKGSFKYAWACDKQKAERERGITINPSYHKIQANNYLLSFFDTPGHRDYIKNLISCLTLADVVLFIISAADQEYEAGKSSTGQNRELISMAFTFGIKQVVVAVNKMDQNTVNWKQQRFEEIRNETTAYFNKIGYQDKYIHFIPVSGWNGDNLTQKKLKKG